MNIRAAVSSDSGAIAQLHVQSWQHTYSAILPGPFLSALSVEGRTRMWAQAIEKQTQQLLVAEVEDAIVGFSAFGTCRDPEAGPIDFEIWAIYVTPGLLGTGVGRQLWLESHARIQASGSSRVTLWVLAANDRAIRFYRAAGFAQDPGSAKATQIGGVSVEEVRYAQTIVG